MLKILTNTSDTILKYFENYFPKYFRKYNQENIEEFNKVKEKQNEMFTELLRLSIKVDGAIPDTVNVTGVTISPSTLNLDIDETSQLTRTIEPINATDRTGVWSSNDTDVATVSSSGLVTAISDGTCTITFTTNDGSFTDTTSVTVEEAVVEEVKAFPSAVGAGADATGGRGGAVIHVTNLNWGGAGSLKAALQTTGARTIVFDVSGEIVVTDTYFELGSEYDNLTIAGQSAPEGGITIRTGYFSFTNVDNVIIRYVRFRNKGNPVGTDAIWCQQADNVIFDHCSFSHGQDECLDISYSQGASGNVTVQNCLFTDSKTGAILGTDTRGEGTPLPDLGNFTFVNNVFSNISHRFPNPQGRGQYDIINNVVYNWKERLVRVTSGGTYNIVNNYYKPAAEGLRRSGWFPGSASLKQRLQKLQTSSTESPLIYTAGNIVETEREVPQSDDKDMWTIFAGSHLTAGINAPSGYFTGTQFPLVGVGYTIKTAEETYNSILEDVGAYKYLNADGSVGIYRDTKDAADIEMIETDGFESYESNDFTYPPYSTIPYPTLPNNTRSSFYGMNQHIPAAYLTARGVTNTTTVHNDIAPSGYTWLEEYLNEVDN